MRPALVLATAAALLGFAGCGPAESPSEDSPTAAPGASDTTTTDTASAAGERSPAQRRALRIARRRIARTDSLFQTVEPLTAAEKRRLRAYLQDTHMARARRLGLDPVRTRRAAADLENRGDSTVARLYTNDYYIVDPAMGYAVPLVVPSTKHALERLGRRFQDHLRRHGLPPYRFILTNILRSGQDQAAISGVSVNAAEGQSSHEYGTSFDVFYGWFHYAAVHDTLAAGAALDSAQAQAKPLDETLLRRQLYEAYVDFGEKHARKIKAVMGRSLLEMQDEERLLSIYERQEPVIHVTLGRRVEPPAPKNDSTSAPPPPG
jgi:hypothetical protein